MTSKKPDEPEWNAARKQRSGKIFLWSVSAFQDGDAETCEALSEPNIFAGLYQRIYSSLYGAYSKAFLSSENQIVRSVGLVAYKNIIGLSHYLYDCQRLDELSAMNCSGLRGAPCQSPADMMTKIRSSFRPNEAPSPIGAVRQLLEMSKALKVNKGTRGRILSLLFPFCKVPPIYMIGDPEQKEILRYLSEISQLDIACLRPTAFSFPSSRHSASPELSQAMVEFRALAQNALPSRIFRELEPKLGGLDIFHSSCEDAIKCAARRIGRIGMRELLVTHIGNIQHRIFASAWRLNGGSVKGFTHGNIYPYAYNPGDSINGANEILDNFVVCSKGEKFLIEEAMRDFKPDFPLHCRIDSLKSSVYEPLYSRLQSVKCGSPGARRVAIIGHPMDNFNSPRLKFMNTLSIFSLEIKLAKFLKKHSYQVVYKAHPDSLPITLPIFQKIADETVSGRFENDFSSFDAVIFTKPFSTSFGFALMTKLPIILMNSTEIKWHPDVLPLLEKRCAMTPVHLDEGGAIVFDERQLLASIESCRHKKDCSIVEKFAF